jgi:hypothetical protein
MENVYPLQWGLREIFEHTEVLLNRDDVDAKADAVLSLIEEKVVRKRDPNYTLGVTVTDFQRLETWFSRVIEEMEMDGKKEWHSHHIATLYKVRNRLMNITTRCKGLVANGDANSDLPWGNLKRIIFMWWMWQIWNHWRRIWYLPGLSAKYANCWKKLLWV